MVLSPSISAALLSPSQLELELNSLYRKRESTNDINLIILILAELTLNYLFYPPVFNVSIICSAIWR
jgi:hypothetical protein